MKKYSVLALAAFAFLPSLASAQSLGNIENLVQAIGRLVNLATPIVVGLALLAFFWGLVKFIFAQGDEDKSSEGKQLMIYGIIALFVMVAVVGLVKFIANAFDVQTGGSLPVPGVQR